MSQTETEVECTTPWTSVIGKGKRRFIGTSLPSPSLWIERKIFCAFPLITGRTIRVIEVLSDRRFTIDFKSNELPWLIGALREAVKANPKVPFSKVVTIGRRSMVLSIVTNRAGVYSKLWCSLGGKNRKLLFIPAGEKGGGWSDLANLLANVSAGANNYVQKPVSAPSNHSPKSDPTLRRDSTVLVNVSFAEAVSGQAKQKDILNDEPIWKEGFLPEFLVYGLNLSLGAPSSSHEASRRFAWKTMQSEFGSGMLVVEKAFVSESPCRKLINSRDSEMGCEKNSSGGDVSTNSDSVSGYEDDEETCSAGGEDGDGGAIFGNSNFPSQSSKSPSGVPHISCSTFQESGPQYPKDMDTLDFVSSSGTSHHVEKSVNKDLWALQTTESRKYGGVGLGKLPFVSSNSPASTNLEESSVADTLIVDFGMLPFDMGLNLSKSAAKHYDCSRKAIESPFLAQDPCAAPARGSLAVVSPSVPDSQAGSSPEVAEVQRSLGDSLSPSKGDSLALASNTRLNSFVNPLQSEATNFQRLKNDHNEPRSLASYDEVTLADVDDEDTLDSPKHDSSGCKDGMGNQICGEAGYCVPDDFISVFVHEQRVFNFVEKLSSLGVTHPGDTVAIQALLIKELVNESPRKISMEEGLSPVAVLDASDLEDAAIRSNAEGSDD